jgi:hypothetical protein
MQFNFAYGGDSTVSNGVDRTALSFAPDILRPPTFLRGKLRDALAFREAIGALHEVVVSDLRWKPKDRTEYLRWRASRENVDLAEVAAQRRETIARI